jgi:Fe-S cluster assembly iron-binding protein IscA
MGVAPNAEEGDETIAKNGLKVFLEREANKMLENATIGFVEEQGFTIDGLMPSSCPTGSCPTSGGSCQ